MKNYNDIIWVYYASSGNEIHNILYIFVILSVSTNIYVQYANVFKISNLAKIFFHACLFFSMYITFQFF